jgi:hypothetical protein
LTLLTRRGYVRAVRSPKRNVHRPRSAWNRL